MEWEQIDKLTYRTKVHGGWLVKHYEDLWNAQGDTIASGFHSMCHVPDEKHEWIVGENYEG